MGKLRDALSPVSSYAAKKTPLWDDLTDRVAGALLPADLDAITVWVEFHYLEVPGAFRECLDEIIEKRREEMAAEEIGGIVSRFDFT
jgi:hypothetical protein